MSLFLLNTKDDIFKNVGNPIVAAWYPLTSRVFFFHIMEINGYRQLFGYQHSSNIFFCVQRKKLTGLEQHEGELIMTFFFVCVNYSFKS